MEELGSLAVWLGAAWLSLVFALIVLPSALGVSLGISEAYMWVLVKTLEWATIRIEKGVKKPQPQMLKIPAANGIIERDETPMEKEIAGLHRMEFRFSDIFYFCRKGFEAIVEDEVTQRFSSEELVSWNLLTRTNVNFHYVSLRLTVVWVIGVIVRYCFLLPLRENKPQKGGICVANHTSPIDAIILTNDGCYAMVRGD